MADACRHLKYAKLKRWQCPAPAGISRYQPVSSGQSKWASQACPTGTMAMSCAGRDQPVSACIVRPVKMGTSGMSDRYNGNVLRRQGSAGISLYCQASQSGQLKHCYDKVRCRQARALPAAACNRMPPAGTSHAPTYVRIGHIEPGPIITMPTRSCACRKQPVSSG